MADTPRRLVRTLAAIVGETNVLTDPADRWTYGYDNSRRQAQPDAVVFATSHAQARDVVRACNDIRVPLVTRGRGTGTTGGSVPLHGGVVLSLERMDRVLEFDAANRSIRVESGITNQAVQNTAAAEGLFWAPDPTSAAYCTVGGNLAVNAAGPRAVKYGSTRDNVLGLRAITGAGVEIHTGVQTTKGVVGYDLTRLLIGSEGTLAVITEATLKLLPLPEAKQTYQAIYRDIRSATEAVVRIMAQPQTPCALEFMDAQAVEMVREHSAVDLPRGAGALLMIEIDGPAAALATAAKALEAAAHNAGLLRFSAAADAAEAAGLWATRKALSPALRNVAPNKLNEDVVVPVTRIPDLIEGLAQLSQTFGIPIVNFGHAGNGNIHVNLLYDTQDPKQQANARPCISRVFDLVLQLGGTLSGEHGVGVEKRDYVAREIDGPTLALMHAIKRNFDPNGILNPGKTLPDLSTATNEEHLASTPHGL